MKMFVLLCSMSFATATQAADLVVDADATTRSTLPGQNFGSLPQLQVDGTSKSYVRFNLAPVPSGMASQLVKATLHLYVNRLVTPGQLLVGVAGGQWAEGAITEVNAPAVNPLTAVTVDKTMGWVTADVTFAVRQWLAGLPNDGFALTSAGAAVMLDAKESVSTSQPARLVLTFAGPPGPAGQPGPQGPPGPMGLTGPSTLRDVLFLRRHETSLSGDSRGNYVIECPSSYPYVVSGGCGHRDFNSAQTDITVNYSGPHPSDPGGAWNCKLNNDSSSSRAILVWAVCSK